MKKFLIIAAIICVAVYMCSPDSDNANEYDAISEELDMPANTNSSLQNNNTYETERDNESLDVTSGNTYNYPKNYSTYQEACKNNDFDAAHNMLDEKRKEYADALAKFNGWNEEEYYAARDLYYEAFDYIYKNEVQFILINFKDEECRDKIQFLLTDIPVIGEKREEGLCDYYEALADHENGKYIHAYKTWAEHFNRLCDTVLTLAINRQYKSTARMALLQIVDNMQITRGSRDIKVDGIPVDGNHGYVKYVGTDRMEAKRKFDEAVELGAFE